MNVADYILLIILALFAFRGLKMGFVSAVGRLIGIVIGAWAAGRYYGPSAGWLVYRFNVNIMAAIVVSFIVIYLAVNIVMGLATMVVTKIFRIIPLATTTNRILGGLLGLLEGTLLIGLIIWIITLFPFQNAFATSLKESRIGGYMIGATAIVQPLLPQGLRQINYIDIQQLQGFADEKARLLEQSIPGFLQEAQKANELKKIIDQPTN